MLSSGVSRLVVSYRVSCVQDVTHAFIAANPVKSRSERTCKRSAANEKVASENAKCDGMEWVGRGGGEALSRRVASCRSPESALDSTRPAPQVEDAAGSPEPQRVTAMSGQR